MHEPQPKRYFITTPIYYVNGQPHVGTALTTVACDVLARYHRLRGEEVLLLTGTDENATKVQEAADRAGVPPLAFADRLADAFRAAWDDLHIQPDDFIRTTEQRHEHAVQEFFIRLLAKGHVYQDTYEGWYSVSDETFFRESEVRDGIAIETGKPVVRVQEQNYFFRLSAFGERLKAHIEAHPDLLQPDFRRNETLAFLNEGLRDMSITRANRGWGIPVPGEPDKVIYVWFDALVNYLAATGWPDDPGWQRVWPADLHFMGKEIFVRFHATLWPAMLMALDLPLPRHIFGHGHWTIQGQKGGKTGASLPHPTRLARLIAARSGASQDIAADALRYLLWREMNYGQDTEFSVENFLRRFNTDLANDLGNLVNRTVNMVGRYCGGTVPVVEAHDAKIAALAVHVQEEYARAMADCRLNSALEAVWRLVARMNKYIDEMAPWSLAKSSANGDAASGAALAAVLYACLEAIRIVSVLVGPFMPFAVRALRAQLGLPEALPDGCWASLAWGGMTGGSPVGPARPLFPRIQDVTVDEKTLFALGSANPERPGSDSDAVPPHHNTDNVKESAVVNAPETVARPAEETGPPGAVPPVPPPASQAPASIAIEDFMKVNLKVGEILAAESLPNASKLLRLTVQVGEDDTRTILAGIAEYYTPDQLVGLQVVVVANLQPRKMRGIESQGMLLAADVDGRAVLVRPEAVVPVGARVR